VSRADSGVADCGGLRPSALSPDWLPDEPCRWCCGAVGFRIVLSSGELPGLAERCASTEGRASEPRFYRRLGRGAGLTLLRVLRRGLELGECLGETAHRAN
jgi:hypothetical protein